MGETIERSQPSNKLILDTCLSYSEVFYRNRGCEKAPLAFLAFLIFRFLTFQGTVSYWIQGYQYICTSIIARNKFVRSINSLLYFHRPQPQPYQFRGRKNTPTYIQRYRKRLGPNKTSVLSAQEVLDALFSTHSWRPLNRRYIDTNWISRIPD